MEVPGSKQIIAEYLDHLKEKEFPCVAVKSALSMHQVHCMVADSMACPKDDHGIVQFLYDFIAGYRAVGTNYHSAAIIFRGPDIRSESMFDTLLWQRLQSIADIDAVHHKYDSRVDADPASATFSFSIGEEGFYIIGLHPQSSRRSRQFHYPALVFNPHAQFEQLRSTEQYERMKKTVRKRDKEYSGSVNPMLSDFGSSSEVWQYSGRKYGADWKCPLKINHAGTTNNTTP